jgi:hypothetical protein
LTTPFAWDSPDSPYDGTRRDVYLGGTAVRNEGGPERLWTDPYGGNAQAFPFPGALCQLVSPVDNGDEGEARTQVFGRGQSFDAEGVHGPN